MIRHFSKYRRKYTTAALAAYLLLLSLSVMHYHHINILNGDYQYRCDIPATAYDSFDRFVDGTHECTVQHAAQTVIAFGFDSVFIIINGTDSQKVTLKEVTKLPPSPHHNGNPLRAPPLFS